MRIELTNAGATIRCVNHFATSAVSTACINLHYFVYFVKLFYKNIYIIFNNYYTIKKTNK